MEVNVKIYQTPRPHGREGDQLQHARISSKGTRRMKDICDRLLHLGLNSAQIKGILDGLAKYVGESLTEGYHIELEGIGTFSLSVRTVQETDEMGKRKIFIIPDGVNFKCSRPLRAKIDKTKLVIQKVPPVKQLPEATRRSKLISYLNKYGQINQPQYAKLVDITLYKARKDLNIYLQDGLVQTVGASTHKVYALNVSSK